MLRNDLKFYNILMFLLLLPNFFASFSGFSGISFFGELSSELFTYLFLFFSFPVFLLYLLKNKILFDKKICIFFFFFMLAVIVSFFINFDDISTSHFRGRSGMSKHFSSFVVIIYSLVLSIYFYNVFHFLEILGKPLFLFKIFWLSFVLLLPFCVLEITDWYVPNPIISYLELNYFASTFAETTGRLRGMSAEPSFFANYLVFILVIVLCFRRQLNISKFLVAILFLAIVLTGSRTAHLCCLLVLFCYFLFTYGVFSLVKNYVYFLIAIILFSFILMYVNSELLGWSFAESGNISNLSRMSSIYNSLVIFFEHPFFGVGLGQYAFQAQGLLTAWSEESYEIVLWFTDDEYTWPPTFSLHARLLAEMGVLGYVAFFFFFLYLNTRLNNIAINNRREDIFCRLLLVYCISISFSFDSFRNPFFWCSFAYVCFFISKERVSHGK